jgi:hypothetical protein
MGDGLKEIGSVPRFGLDSLKADQNELYSGIRHLMDTRSLISDPGTFVFFFVPNYFVFLILL